MTDSDPRLCDRWLTKWLTNGSARVGSSSDGVRLINPRTRAILARKSGLFRPIPTTGSKSNRECGRDLRKGRRLTSSKSSSKMALPPLCWHFSGTLPPLCLTAAASMHGILSNCEDRDETPIPTVSAAQRHVLPGRPYHEETGDRIEPRVYDNFVAPTRPATNVTNRGRRSRI